MKVDGDLYYSKAPKIITLIKLVHMTHTKLLKSYNSFIWRSTITLSVNTGLKFALFLTQNYKSYCFYGTFILF